MSTFLFVFRRTIQTTAMNLVMWLIVQLIFLPSLNYLKIKLLEAISEESFISLPRDTSTNCLQKSLFLTRKLPSLVMQSAESGKMERIVWSHNMEESFKTILSVLTFIFYLSSISCHLRGLICVKLFKFAGNI